MALTITEVKRLATGGLRAVVADVTFDSSYATGGESLAPGLVGLSEIVFVRVGNKAGYTFEFDYTNKKLKAFTPTAAHTHTENTAGAYAQNATTSASAVAVAAEVANTTNLSAISVRVVIEGI